MCIYIAMGSPTVLADDPPPPSSTSTVGQMVTNPVNNETTTVSALLVDPAGTATAGDTAFVQTADGYTFLVKSAGNQFYNSDTPPVAFTITSISDSLAVVTSSEATGTADFPVGQTTLDFNASFNSSESPGILIPPVDVTGPNGVKQVIYGRDGSNGRDGALFVPPSTGKGGDTGPANDKTLNENVNATSNIGWEVGSIGGDGGKGGDSYASFWSGRDGGDGGTGGRVIAAQDASSTIQASGDGNYGIFAYSRSGEAGDGGSGFAAPGGGTGGHSSDGGHVTIEQSGKIFTSGNNAHGIYALSVSNNGGNGGDQWGLVGQAGDGGYGGDGGQVDVKTSADATILTAGNFANGILAQSIGGSGGSAGSSGNLLVSLIGSADNGGNGRVVTVANGGIIETNGTASRGIMAQSIGGGGGAGGTADGLVALALGGVGSNGGSGGAVNVTNSRTGSILTTGGLADGIMAQSIGGSGGQGANTYGLVSIGGNGSQGGGGSAVDVSNHGRIETRGDGARGIIAQSIGGGGGDGGSSGGMVSVGGNGSGGGAGSTVSVMNVGVIKTQGHDAMGIIAQSIGGGGGNGGSSGSVGAFIGVGVGGKGGAGGQGGEANMTLSSVDASQPSQIMTSGNRSAGVFVQSVGGGGGNGGGAVSVAVGAFGAATVSVGGTGGTGGNGGAATLTGNGATSVQTGGDDAAGILLQSVGGGGGNGGYAISAAASAGPVSGSLAVGVGGSGGSGGAGGEVRVGTIDGSGNLTGPGFSGNVVTKGERSAGMLFQSIGGGGGNGGLAVAASGGGSLIFSGNISIGVGGGGGVGGTGGRVRIYTDADITTLGNSSAALLTQSIGGGGGNGGGSITAGVAGSGDSAASINIGVGGSSAGAGAGDAVDLVAGGDLIRTAGQFSTAVVAQSVGGGGGNGGYTVAAGAAGAGAGAGSINVGVGGSAGGGGNGGTVNAQVDAVVTTQGDDSGAILIQSVGGGGGNGGFSVAAGEAGSGVGAGAVSVALGGSGGEGGEGGAVAAKINSDVATQGERAAGVVAQSVGGGGGNGGFNISGSITGAGTGAGTVSVGLGGTGAGGGDGGMVNVTSNGTILTEGFASTAFVAQSIGGGGGNGGFNVSPGLALAGTGAGSVTVGLGGSSAGGGDGSTVTARTTANIETRGGASTGILAQSIGGGGGNGSFNITPIVSGADTGSGSISVSLGGNGGSGGNGGTVGLTVENDVLTHGAQSSAVVAQSIGGGGGNGGFNVTVAGTGAGTGSGTIGFGLGGRGGTGGTGGAVDSTVAGNLTTLGDNSTGMLVQSVGGGGGNGGINVSGTVSIAGIGSGTTAIGIGGFGGNGGSAGDVTSSYSGTVLTFSERSAGVVTQSLGGGGGNGGINVSGTVNLTQQNGGAASLGVGGFGSGGGNGGNVTSKVRVTDARDNITTIGNESIAVMAQSVGGSGGTGGLNVGGSVSLTGQSGAAVSLGVGGFGGAGGDAGSVDLDVIGTVNTFGDRSTGLMAQSLGGGGGVGGIDISGTLALTKPSDTNTVFSIAAGVGGFGGGGGDAGAVSLSYSGTLSALPRTIHGDGSVTVNETQGADGLVAQSIGGGGGDGGINVSGGVTISSRPGAGQPDSSKSYGALIGVGGFGGTGGDAGTVDVNVADGSTIRAHGTGRSGILAQSVGGGGGNGGMNVSGQLNWGSSDSSGGATDLGIVAGLGGHGGVGADAGDVDVTSIGDITTNGYSARGILAQSIGGGGGTGGINVTAVATKDSTPVGIGIGGSSTSGGNAGNVSITRGTATLLAGLIKTDGVGAHGIEASSIGGGGGDAGINAVLGVSKTTGSGSNSGSAGNRKETVNDGVDPSVVTDITNTIDKADAATGKGGSGSNKTVNSAIIAVGGSAGNAGNGGQVDVTHFGDIVTLQNGSYGVFAQSLGGGGGNAAFNAGLVFEPGDVSQNRGFGMAIGGGTGAGGTGGNVTIDSMGNIDTQGDDAHGIFAQTVGGGGGNAGFNQLTVGGEDGNIGISIGRTGGIGGTAGDVFVKSDSQVRTQGARSHGLFAQSIGNGGGNSTATSIVLSTPKGEDKTGNSVAIKVGLEGGKGGAAGRVTIKSKGLLYMLGEDSHGIFAQSVGGGGGNGGGVMGSAGKATSYSLNIGGTGGTGGISGAVDVTSAARIATEGARSIGILAQSVGGAGGTGGYANAGTSSLITLINFVKGTEIGTTTSVNIGGTGGDGMSSGDVTVANSGVVTTIGDSAHGIMAQSVGGGGGKGGLIENRIVNLHSTIASTSTLSIGGTGGTGAISGNVSVTNTSDIGTEGRQAAGIFAQAVGGGGGDAQHVRNIIAGINADNSTRNALLIGGSGGTGGGGGAVDAVNATGARIITNGAESHGIFAQSIGGGGGNGSEVLSVFVTKPDSTAKTEQGLQLVIGGNGGAGGTSGPVNVVNDGLIVTRGDKAHGILAQSIGGGGGNGGYSMNGSLALQKGTEAIPTMALSIGGSGGSGNAAGDVTIANTGEIDVSGAQSYGVLAQSVGGGGGNGGLTVALSPNDQARGQSYSKIDVGGVGGDGADGGDVTANHSGAIRLSGENSYGIFAQSVGGGGGNATLGLSTPAAMATDHIISTTLGARLGSKGTAGAVSVNSTGDIIVTGAGSQAIFSQSVNGGGGSVDTYLDFAKAASSTDPLISLTSTIALGGNDVDGSAGATVSQVHRGDIVTTSYRSAGMLLQSIGGGGGISTTTIDSGASGDATLSAMLGAIDTDDASGGNVVASRGGNVTTMGDLSSGGLAQSIGGGGGRVVITGNNGAGGSGRRNAVVTLGADPSFRNNGGDIMLTLNGTVSTEGNNASGQIVQSIGGGGGETYLTGIDHATITLGASDGSTGDGGAIMLDNIGDMSTAGARSHGLVLQSIGGGGGFIGTDLAASRVDLLLSNSNGGEGGNINFTNNGNVLLTGKDSIGVLAQSLGGGGGTVDGLFHGSAGGRGSGGRIALDLTGNVLSLGERGIAIMAQSEGRDGADNIDVALNGVIVGGRNGQIDASLTSNAAAIVIDGGATNTLSFSTDSFLMALNNRIVSGSSGSERVILNGRAVGDIDLGGGINRMTVSQGASFYAQNQVDLGSAGELHIDGNLYLGGVAYLPSTTLNARIAASDFQVTENVSQTTALNGSLSFSKTATYTADVYFRQDLAADGYTDLINVSGDATIAGTVYPVLHQLDRLQPLVLINADGVTANNGTTVVGTPVMSYEIGLNGPTGDGSTIDLIPHADFRMPGMNRNQTRTAEFIAHMLSGQGSVDMGPMFALIANMQTNAEIIDAIDNLGSEDYAATQVDALYSGYHFARSMADCGYDNFAARMGDSRSCYWLTGSASTLKRDPSLQYRSFETQTSGLFTGIRMPLTEDIYLGVGTGLENFSLASGDRFAADGRRAMLGVSLSKYKGPWEIYGILNGSTAQYDSMRQIDIYGLLANGFPVTGGTATVKQRISQANFRLGSAYRFKPDGSALYLRPALDFDASYLHSGGASESNTAYGLNLDSTGQWVLAATPSFELGVDTQVTSTFWMQAYLRGELSFSNKDDVFIDATLAGASGSDGVFHNYSQIGELTGRLDTGLTFYDNDTTTSLTFGYQAQWSGDMVGHTATVNFGLRF
ncbi:autotransporter outer membrane beta-barrel domain-containing protein [Falsochrobactrum tianjinense]|nr:autotransporter outer membrane beta-barrel domain-containing protein [Falsochrobactrum sp. TDYN1]